MDTSTDRSADSRPIYRPTVDRLMCTYRLMHRPTFGRYIGRLSVDYRSTIGRPINVYISGDALVDYRSIYRSIIGRLSVDCRSTVGRLSVDCRPIVGRLPTDSRPIVDRYIGRLSAYMSTEATYCTHDPIHAGLHASSIFPKISLW